MNGLILLLLVSVALIISIVIFFDLDKKLEKREDDAIGKLIVIEGIEGSGKTELIGLMKEQMPPEWAYTKEPYYYTDSEVAWTKENYQLDRESHVQNKILPMLYQNKVLVTNRYWTSGCVYDGWPQDAYLSIWPDPDIIIWLDREPTEEMASKVQLPFGLLKELRARYADLFKNLSHEHHIPVIHLEVTGKSHEEVLSMVKKELRKFLPLKGEEREHEALEGMPQLRAA